MSDERLVLSIAYDREEDGRFIAEVPELPEILPAYGATEAEARRNVMALVYYWLAERIDDGATPTPPSAVEFKAA